MLRSDFSRKARANFQNYFFARNVFSSTLTSNRRQFHVKLKSILNQIFLLLFLDVFYHFNAANIKIRLFRCVNNPTKYKLFDASQKALPHVVTSL